MAAQNLTAETPTPEASASDFPSVLSSLIDASKRLAGGVRQSLEQGAEEMLALGNGLCVLKEAVPHGEFLSVVGERLGLNSSTASKMLAAARCFRKGTPRRSLTVLGKARMYELTVQDEDGLDALANGGTLHGCTLAEIQEMSIKRLRAWLRDQARPQAQQPESAAQTTPQTDDKTVDFDRFKQGAKCLVDETFTAPLQPGDRIRSLHAKRPGSVVRVYHDGSACILWDDGEPQAEGLGHERMPRELLELVKRPDPGAARARRKDYCRELCRVIARYADDAEVTELSRALEGVSANILARRYCPGLNAAAYDVFARLGMKGGVQ